MASRQDLAQDAIAKVLLYIDSNPAKNCQTKAAQEEFLEQVVNNEEVSKMTKPRGGGEAKVQHDVHSLRNTFITAVKDHLKPADLGQKSGTIESVFEFGASMLKESYGGVKRYRQLKAERDQQSKEDHEQRAGDASAEAAPTEDTARAATPKAKSGVLKLSLKRKLEKEAETQPSEERNQSPESSSTSPGDDDRRKKSKKPQEAISDAQALPQRGEQPATRTDRQEPYRRQRMFDMPHPLGENVTYEDERERLKRYEAPASIIAGFREQHGLGMTDVKVQEQMADLFKDITDLVVSYCDDNKLELRVDAILVEAPKPELQKLYTLFFGDENWRIKPFIWKSTTGLRNLKSHDLLHGLIGAGVYRTVFCRQSPCDVKQIFDQCFASLTKYGAAPVTLEGDLKEYTYNLMFDKTFVANEIVPHAVKLADELAAVLDEHLDVFKFAQEGGERDVYFKTSVTVAWIEDLREIFKKALILRHKMETAINSTFEYVWMKPGRLDETLRTGVEMPGNPIGPQEILATMWPVIRATDVKSGEAMWISRARVLNNRIKDNVADA